MSARPFLLALLAAALFGAATPLSKSLLGQLGPFQLSGLLYLGAAVGVAPLLAREGAVRPPWRMERRTRRLLLGAIVFGGILGPVLLLFGLRLAAATSVSLWLNLEAVMTAVLGFFVFHDRLGRNGWLGAAGIVLAAVLLTWGQGAAGWTGGPVGRRRHLLLGAGQSLHGAHRRHHPGAEHVLEGVGGRAGESEHRAAHRAAHGAAAGGAAGARGGRLCVWDQHHALHRRRAPVGGDAEPARVFYGALFRHCAGGVVARGDDRPRRDRSRGADGRVGRPADDRSGTRTRTRTCRWNTNTGIVTTSITRTTTM